jgi:hypothetical protein
LQALAQPLRPLTCTTGLGGAGDEANDRIYLYYRFYLGTYPGYVLPVLYGHPS